jgi:hypothetical protein
MTERQRTPASPELGRIQAGVPLEQNLERSVANQRELISYANFATVRTAVDP